MAATAPGGNVRRGRSTRWDSRRQRLAMLAIVVAGVVLSAVAAQMTVSGSPSRFAGLLGMARGLIVAVPIAVGLYARQRPPFERFGRLLVITGLAGFLTTLSESSDALLYSVGRISGWLIEPWLIFLMLAFPSGRLLGTADRRLTAGAVVLVATLYAPTALVVDHYPVPNPWTSCRADCPSNALMVVSPEPPAIEDVVRPLREVLTVAVFVGVTLRLAFRIRGATRLSRRTLTPVLGVAILRAVAFAVGLMTRWVNPGSWFVEVCAWLLALAVPGLAIAFLTGRARWRGFVSAALRRLGARLATAHRPEDLRAALAEAFEDDRLEIAYWLEDGGGWTDARGRAVSLPASDSGRWGTELRNGDRRVAAIIHDAVLRDERAFIDAASSYAIVTLENHRLSTRAASLVREVRDSRARILATADDERRRIERDLHDGAQQRLVALRIHLELAAERLGAREGGAELLRLGSEVDEAIAEVRSLAQGLYPAPLADHGLEHAIHTAAAHVGLPTTVVARGIGRYPPRIEFAAYFCCLEALQNAAKHARGATCVAVELRDDGALHIEVRDDGSGFDSTRVNAGTGLMGMRDRVEGVGGELTIDSAPGRGTRVAASIPLGPWAGDAAPCADGAPPSI